MGDRTKIQWTDATWNVTRGCNRVSDGCRHCYAERVAHRFSGPGKPYEGLVTVGKKGPRWNGTIRKVPEHLDDPLRWTKPRLVFVNSMSDLFFEGLDFEYIAAVFGVMAASPRHTFQVLTKRPERAAEFFAWLEGSNSGHPLTRRRTWLGAYAETALADAGIGSDRLFAGYGDGPAWPLPNVWLGVSVEDQATADLRIPQLLKLPASVRWVSYEPALGPVDFDIACDRVSGFINWIVVGGESGPGARPFDLAWARSTIRQGRSAGVPVFCKQLGAVVVDSAFCEKDGTPAFVGGLRHSKGGDWDEWPPALRVREYPR